MAGDEGWGKRAGAKAAAMDGLRSGGRRTADAVGRIREDDKALVGRASDSYRTWASDVAFEPIAPDELEFPDQAPADAAVTALLKEHDPLSTEPASTGVAGLAIDPDAIVLARLLVAASIAEQNRIAGSSRHERMERYLHCRLFDIRSAIKAKGEFSTAAVLRGLMSDWNESQRLLLLIEATSSNPFEPYEIAWDPNHELAALSYLATVIDLPSQTALDVASTFRDAAQAHQRISVTRVGLYGLGAAAALGGAGFLVAPAVGAALGSAAGLSGAAATSYGLGLLGGVAGATPGAMTAGGMWLVAHVGATAGAVAGSAGLALYEMGASAAQDEIIKLQVTYKMIVVDLQHNDAVALDLLGSVEERLAILEGALQDELEFSDPGSDRVANMTATANSLRTAERWMDDKLEIVDDGSLIVNLSSADARLARLEQAVRNRKGSTPPNFDSALAQQFPSAGLTKISDRIQCRFEVRADLDRFDVITAIAAGITAATVDAFIVGDPSNELTSRLRDGASNRGGNWLEQLAKVPYDPSIAPGMTPSTHRVLTPGHDPLIGLVIGTRDILQSTMTRSDIAGAVQFVERPTVAGSDSLFSALLTQVAHLFSDVVTPAGLPLPGWSALTTVPRYAETAVKMYAHGYDTWHLAPMSVPGGAVHAVTSTYWAMRDETEVSQDRKDAVNLLAFGIASIGDLASMLATNRNPLSLNYVMWLTLARRIVKQANRRSRRSARVTIDDATQNQHLLNHGWSALVG